MPAAAALATAVARLVKLNNRAVSTKRHSASRRAGLLPRAAAALACACFLSAGAGGCVGGDPAYSCADCNVILISADTMRADHVGSYGYSRPTTPNIDALASRGVLFENAISQSSWTRPAHFSMLTGRFPNEHGIIALKDREPPRDEIVTLASALFAHGYRTAAFTGGLNLSAAFGFDRGFETYRSNGKYFRDNLEETRLWLDRHGDEKFFLFWHGYDPHTPYASDPIDRAALDIPPRPVVGLRRACRAPRFRAEVSRYVAEYDAVVHRADRYVGKLLAEIEARGLAERTVIVFTSDHGEEFLEHGRCFHVNTLYREVLHVPLVIAGPGLEARRVRRLVPASVSIAPTILEIVGARRTPLPGPSLAAALTGDATVREEVVSETSRDPRAGGNGHLRALTTEDGKLIHSLADDRYAYFDARGDPREQVRLERGSSLDGLRTRLAAWLERHPSHVAGAGESSPVDDESNTLDAQLRALGYRE